MQSERVRREHIKRKKKVRSRIALGQTDREIATALSIGVTTVRRSLDELMKQYDAITREQLALKITERSSHARRVLRRRYDTSRVSRLSIREGEVLSMLSEGTQSRSGIASTLGISRATVDKHVTHALDILGVPKVPAAIALHRLVSGPFLKRRII